MTDRWLCDVAGCTYEGVKDRSAFAGDPFVLCAHHDALPKRMLEDMMVKLVPVPYPTPGPRSRRLTLHHQETP